MQKARTIGVVATLLLMISCVLNWTWYPDIEKHFTGFYSEGNYYGRPGKMLYFFALTSLLFFAVNKVWMQRINLIFTAIGMAYAIYVFILFTGGYDGFVPTPKPGIYLMLGSAITMLVMAVLGLAVVKNKVPTTVEQAQPEVPATAVE